jgi:type I restriction-modification system DNA methylase subunit
MSLFQKSVINKYLKTLDSVEVEKSYLKFQEFYADKERIENIRLLKEENYQEGFLRELFVQVLGYTIKPDKNSNLTTEFKNLTDAKKADGAILDDGKAIGVIELKSTKTILLESITEQAFNYKNHQPNCRYIITSNFEKIRFYIDNATDFEEFNLFTLSEKDFKILYLILSKASIFSDIPLKLKKGSVLHEENISKQLYQDYSNFKLKIFENLVQNNPQYNKLTLFKKSQKLLDRLIFIFFAEDSGLLPANSISRIIDRYNILKDEDAYRPLYEIYKQYFNYMNVGRKGKIKSDNIDAYNGGLFIPDTILDNIIIDDEILKDDSLKLSKYDFNTDLDVNILGHIFENSLNEIEELTAELEGKPLDKKKTKRKKEGIFYTPKYITKYIVENTVGELCNQKKKELNLDEIDISIIQNSRTKKRKLNHKAVDLLGRLKTYTDYLLSLKILDPACGSGAFLNQALEFLIEEHQFVDEYRRQLEKDSLGLFDVKKSILENNLYGVDINEESVEIAKLSLWLRTAERGRKLSDLSNSIKCGNSLIDDPDVAGEKAFKWEDEFPDIMANGGFDVVIGNPPYLGGRDWKDEDSRDYNYFISKFEVAEYQFDMYVLFWEKGIKILKQGGLIGFITPNTWLNNQKTQNLRDFILSRTSIIKAADYSDIDVFQQAVVLPVIFILLNTKILNRKIEIYKAVDSNLVFQHTTSQAVWIEDVNKIININISQNDLKIRNKIEKSSEPLEKLAVIKFGIKLYETGKGTPPQKADDAKNHIFESNVKHDESYRKYLEGKDINTYQINWQNRWLKYGKNLAAPRESYLFEGPRLLVRRITGKRLICAYTDEDFVTSQLLQIVKPNDDISVKIILVILSSKLMSYYFKKKYNRLDRTFPEIRIYELRALPIKLPEENSYFLVKADEMHNLNHNVFLKKKKFLNRVKDYFEIDKVSKKIDSFHESDFRTFLTELKKQKLNISLSEQEEWEDYFNERKSEINHLQNQISETDKAIDQMVYELYGLTEEEIQIVENSFEKSN